RSCFTKRPGTTRAFSRGRAGRPATAGVCPRPSRPCLPSALAAGGIYPGLVLDLSSLDLADIAEALADQTDYEHHWLINPETGEIVFWTSDTGIDGHTPVDLDELDLICINPLPSYIWYQ